MSLPLGTFSAKPPSSEQNPDLQLEPTIKFLFTLLNTSEPTEPKDPESDSEIQECQFLDQEDWGPQRISKEIRHLQNDCMRLCELLSTTQMDNQALGERLQNLPTLLYKNLKAGAQAIQDEAQAIQEEVQVLQEAPLIQVPAINFLAELQLHECLCALGLGGEQEATSSKQLGPWATLRHLSPISFCS
ncbi:hypothetical protein TREES_T100019345 [Tupaia chinensis]|uniref:Uncharacterized protein n=1 Tax=Tupaia chinensis TaxID=246437 RepID=L9KQP5_TUPCH|nr:hypothetical protein TREES_T100019345 [Tupaia chinensis]